MEKLNLAAALFGGISIGLFIGSIINRKIVKAAEKLKECAIESQRIANEAVALLNGPAPK